MTNLMSVDMDDLEMICNKARPIIMAVFSTLGAVTVLGLSFLAYKKRWHLKHFFFILKHSIYIKKRNKQQPAYEYDAFILYSGEEEDRLWVHRILVGKENYGMKIHIHLRDFEVGEYIANNVTNAINKARKVIAVVSPNFVRSPWCVEEVHMTHAADPTKLILVLYRDVPAI